MCIRDSNCSDRGTLRHIVEYFHARIRLGEKPLILIDNLDAHLSESVSYTHLNSMFYNIPYEHLGSIRIDEIKTHSFISKEVRLLSYVKDRCV